MKKILVSLLALLLLLLLPSCADTASGDPQESQTIIQTEDTRILLAENGTPLYTVVFPQKSDLKTEAAAQNVQEGLCALTQAKFILTDDWVDRDTDPDAFSDYEILVGGTNRSASSITPENTGNDGWWVMKEGKRIVVNAVSSWTLADAADYVLSLCSFEEGKLYLNTEGCKTEYREHDLTTRSPTLRIGTYNIWLGGNGVGHNMDILAEEIKSFNLDIVGLQEVDKNFERSGYQDVAKLLAEKAGYDHYAYTAAVDHGDSQYGTAILSKYPIKEHEIIRLTVGNGHEPRAIGHAVIDIGGVLIDFFNTHLSHESESSRLVQLDEIAKATEGFRGFIITADFNTTAFIGRKTFGDCKVLNKGQYKTFLPSETAIDNIIADSGWTFLDSGMNPSWNSDHALLWAELKYQAE